MLGAFFEDKRLFVADNKRATKVLEGLRLSQYKYSPNTHEYLLAFVEEMDLLFFDIESCYVGRMLEYAVGAQQDIIGEILDQPRSVSLPDLYFGFHGATGAGSFGDINDPLLIGAGVWKSSGKQHSLTPLEDDTYQRVLLAKAMIMNAETMGYEEVYQCIFILLNRVPVTAQLRPNGHKRVDLLVDVGVTSSEVSLITYMSKYFLPMGVTFTITSE